MADLEQVIEYLKEKNGGPMSDTKLNCLLYLAHGHCLAATGLPLFDAAIYALDYPHIVCQWPRDHTDD